MNDHPHERVVLATEHQIVADADLIKAKMHVRSRHLQVGSTDRLTGIVLARTTSQSPRNSGVGSRMIPIFAIANESGELT